MAVLRDGISALLALLARRAAATRRYSGAHKPRRVLLRQDSENRWAGPCPNSFGNVVHVFLSEILLAVLARGTIELHKPFECSGLVLVRHELVLPPQRNATASGKAPLNLASLHNSSMECTVGQAAHMDDLTNNIDSNRSIYIENKKHSQHNSAASSMARFNTQELAAIAMGPARKHDLQVSTLFALGPHVAYGAMFQAAFAFTSNVSSGREEWHDDDSGLWRVAVHMRHPSPQMRGDELLPAFTEAVSYAVRHSSRPRCAIFLASDRKLAHHHFSLLAGALNCSFLTSTARSVNAEQSNIATANQASWRDSLKPTHEHGNDTKRGALRDLLMLSYGDVLIGSLGSTFTLLAQELMAERYRGVGPVPHVVYCGSGKRCMPPLPLVFTLEEDWWHVSEQLYFLRGRCSRPSPDCEWLISRNLSSKLGARLPCKAMQTLRTRPSE